MAGPISPEALEFGKRVRAAREKTGMSQDRFALAAEIDRSYVGQVERGEKNVTLSTIIRLARALGVDPGNLVRKLGD